MTLSINSNFDQITISSTLLDNFIADPSLYTSIAITGKLNCAETGTTYTYTSASPITDSTEVSTDSGTEYINPDFFSATTFADGVYGFSIVLTPLVGATSKESSCIFVDQFIACNIEPACKDKMLWHYILTNTQDCNCNCAKLCEFYNLIIEEETPIQSGCTSC